jgi:HSP20 family protein
VDEFERSWLMNFRLMQREMERLLGYLGTSKPPVAHFAPKIWEPAVDIYETENELVVVIELAGVKQEEISVAVESKSLLVKGVRRESSATSRKSYHQMEIHSGPFEKMVALPAPVNPDQTKAYYDDGLLKIVLPKIKQEPNFRVRIRQ